MAATMSNFLRNDNGPAISTGAGGTISTWIGATSDVLAVVETSGWFNVLAPYANVGDQINMSMGLAGTPSGKTYIVTVNDGAAVTVAAFL